MNRGGLDVEYTRSVPVIQGQDPLTTCIQNTQYADKLTYWQEGATADAGCP